jgi:hypothetical protein
VLFTLCPSILPWECFTKLALSISSSYSSLNPSPPTLSFETIALTMHEQWKTKWWVNKQVNKQNGVHPCLSSFIYIFGLLSRTLDMFMILLSSWAIDLLLGYQKAWSNFSSNLNFLIF